MERGDCESCDLSVPSRWAWPGEWLAGQGCTAPHPTPPSLCFPTGPELTAAPATQIICAWVPTSWAQTGRSRQATRTHWSWAWRAKSGAPPSLPSPAFSPLPGDLCQQVSFCPGPGEGQNLVLKGMTRTAPGPWGPFLAHHLRTV